MQNKTKLTIHLLFFLLIFFLLISNIKSKNINFEKIIECMISKGNISSSTANSMKKLSKNLTQENNMELSKIIKDHRDIFVKCLDSKKKVSSNFTTIDDVYREVYDWKRYVNCLKTIDLNYTFNNLLTTIQKGQYYEAIKEELRLITQGHKNLKKCTKIKMLNKTSIKKKK